MASLDPTRTRAVEKLNESLIEQGRRSAGEFKRDPEAARGRNRMANDGAAGVIAAPTSVDVKVQGQAEVHQTIALQIEPSNFFQGLVRQVENLAKVGLRSGTDMVGGGTGTTPPRVGPAFSGHSMR